MFAARFDARKFIVLVLAVFGLLCFAPRVHAANYSFYRSITVTSTASIASGTNANFPMEVSSTIAAWASVANGGKIQNLVTAPNGVQEPADLVFATSTANCNSGAYLNFETESYTSSTGALVDWVNIPSLSTGTVVDVCYDNASITTDQSHPSSTWNNNYRAVYHFPNGTILNASDSTAGLNNGVISTSTATSSGEIDGAASFNGSSIINLTQNSGLPIYSTNGYSISFWVNAANCSASTNDIFTEGSGVASQSLLQFACGGSGGPQMLVFLRNQGGSGLFSLNSSSSVYTSTWNKVDWTDNNGTASLYVNGVKDGTNFNYVPSGSFTMTHDAIGAIYRATPIQYLTGSVDELELASTTLSSSWILSAYNNQKSPSTFYAVGNETAPDTTPPTVSWITPSAGVTVSSTITLTASSTDNVSVSNVAFYSGSFGGTFASTTLIGLTSVPSGTLYSVTWNSTSTTNGSTTLWAVSTDGGGNTTIATTTVNVFNVIGLPSISFSASGTIVTSGGPSTLSYNVTNSATLVTIAPIGLSTSTVVGSVTVNPTSTTMYTLVATNLNGSSTATTTVTVTTSSIVLSGLQLWLKADVGCYTDAGITPCTNSSTAYEWADQSGNGNNATEATTSSRPTWKTSQVNGLPAMVFDGSASHFSNSYTGELGTVFVVYKLNGMDSQTTYQDLMGGDTSDSVNLGSYYLQASTGNNALGDNSRRVAFSRTTTLDSNGGGTASWIAQSNAVPTGVWSTLGMIDNSTTLNLFKGTNQVNSASKPAATRSINAGFIGAGFYAHGITDQLNGSIAEILVYNTALSTSSYQQVVSYLDNKYGTDASPTGKYVWAGFEAGGGANAAAADLMLLQSSDGTTWSYRPDNYLPPGTDAVRDPSIFYSTSTTSYWIAHTVHDFGASETYFDVASSSDGFNFNYVGQVDCSSAVGTGNGAACWAPEWFKDSDGSTHIFFAGSATGNSDNKGFQIYETHPTNAGDTAWSTPVGVTGTSLPTNMIDPFMVKVGSTYDLWYTNESTTFVEYATSTSLTSGYSVAKSGNWAGWGTTLEGEALVNTSSTNWTIYLDNQGTNYYYSKSTDNLATWSAKALTTAPYLQQHGTVLNLAAAIPPLLSWTSPGSGATVASTITLTASSSDANDPVASVAFYVGSISPSNIVSTSTVPVGSLYSVSWDTTAVANGVTTLWAVATDGDGNTSSVSTTVNVQNSTNSSPAPSGGVVGVAGGYGVPGYQNFGTPTPTPPPASSGTTIGTAPTTSSLQSQLNALLAELAALQSKAGSAPSSLPSSHFTFTRDLTLNDTGTDVQMLQEFLNASGFILSQAGPGSPGNETARFGAKTWLALSKFQKSVGIPGTGYFGKLTRAYVNAHTK